MNLQEKTGQMIIAGFEGTFVTNEVKEMVLEMNIGGVILFSRNIESPIQLKILCRDLQNLTKSSSTKIPLFISIDQEGGRVARLPRPFKQFESALTIGNSGSTVFARSQAASMAEELNSSGINMDFAPVLDVNTNPNNPIIGDRAFGSEPGVVCAMGCGVIEGLRSHNIIPVGKHFPGHGDTSEDSHIKLPVVTADYKRLQAIELKPFVQAIRNGIEGIMTAHVLYPKIDPQYCATLSEKILQGILREDLNYKGVIISDDMEMNGISDETDIESASLQAVRAGVDIILICKDHNNIKRVYKRLTEAVDMGVLLIERVDESVNRIIALKEKYFFK